MDCTAVGLMYVCQCNKHPERTFSAAHDWLFNPLVEREPMRDEYVMTPSCMSAQVIGLTSQLGWTVDLG